MVLQNSDLIYKIEDKGKLIALIIKDKYIPQGLEFLTTQDLAQQVGIMHCSAGKIIQSHLHKSLKRTIFVTSEAIFIRKGKVEVYIYNNKKEHIDTKVLETGDAIFFFDGGHGFKMIEDAILLEIKQGPYAGADDKERF